jgi:hypothetical protein
MKYENIEDQNINISVWYWDIDIDIFNNTALYYQTMGILVSPGDIAI